MKRLKISATILLLLVFVWSSNAQKKITKEFSGIEKISLNTASGDCIVKKSSGDKVMLTLEHDYDEEDYEPVIEQDGNRLMIKEVFHKNSVSGKAMWSLSIPDDTELKFNTGSGDFEAENIKLEVDMNTGSGDLILKTVTGDIDANTGSGDIALGNFDGTLRANTGSGDIDVDKGKGEIKVNCGSGKIKMNDVSGSIKANVGSGDISVRNAEILQASGFNSGSGDVEVVLSSTPDADLSVNSGSGDAELDFNGNALAGTLVMKANKKKGEISAPIKFDKEEEEKRGSQTIIKKTAELGGKDIKIHIGTGSGKASLSK